MDFYDDFDDEDYDVDKLEFVYRVDKYHLADSASGSIYDMNEYFMIAGDHTVIRLLDIESGQFMIECYNKIVSYTMEDPTVEKVNAMRDALMVYDFCVEVLRAMPKYQAIKNPLCDLKFEIENEFLDSSSDFMIMYQNYLKMDVIESMLERCHYLQSALNAEWKGIISCNRIEDFELPEQLDLYIDNHDLLNHPEGIDKTVDEYKLFKNIREAYRNADTDDLSFMRPYINEVLRIKAFKPQTKEEQIIEEKRTEKYRKATIKCKNIIENAAKMQQKINLGICKPVQEKFYERKIDKLTGKIAKEACQGVFDLLK